MKLPKIKLTRSTRLNLKSEPAPTPDAGAKPADPASQITAPSSARKPAGPLPTSRWNIEKPMPVVSKLRKQSSKEPPKGTPRFETVHFEHVGTEARAVFLAGSFNDWSATATPMHRESVVKWVKELLLPPGCYEYRFVVDGKWLEPPHAKAYVPNPHGGRNAVVEL